MRYHLHRSPSRLPIVQVSALSSCRNVNKHVRFNDCREQAADLCENLTSLLDTLEFTCDDDLINLCAIIHEDSEPDDIKGFCGYFNYSVKGVQRTGNVYFDRNKSFYRAQGMRRTSVFSALTKSVRKAIARALGKGIQSGSLKGDGTLLGGLLVVNSEKVFF